jgi:hypothetical protein
MDAFHARSTAQRTARPAARRAAVALAVLAFALAATRAEAAIGFKSEDGWGASFEGFVNAFGVNEMGSKPPAGVAVDPLMTADEHNSFRVRTGLLPGLFAFNVTAPKIDGLDVKARVGLYPQINNAGTRNAFGSQIDLREIFFTVDGSFGQVLAGRALNLFQGKNILNDMTLFGVGVQGGVASSGTTLGRIGYGYLYSQFGAQLRYTTPSVSGAKLAFAVVDPSQIGGSGVAATQMKTPGFESELSYAAKLGDVRAQGWLSGLYQQAMFDASSAVRAGRDVVAGGGAAGLGAGVGGLDLLASGFVGKGLGSFLLLDTDSLDASGAARKSRGFLAQAAYTLGSTKAGVSYGENRVDETASESAARVAGTAKPTLASRRSVTGGLYHDLNKNLKVVAEYTHAMAGWVTGQSQAVDVVALGGFFLW